MAVLEEQLAKVKEDTKVTNEKTAELSKNSEESIRQARVLKNTTTNEDERQTALEAELTRIVQVEKESSEKYSDVSKKILMIESKLEDVESRAKVLEKTKHEREEELTVLSNNLKSLECAKDKSCRKENILGDKVKVMSSETKEMEARADIAEKAVEKLQDVVERLQENLCDVRKNNEKVESDMESLFHDLRNL